MDKAMISGIDSSWVAVETQVPHEVQHIAPSHGLESTETADKSAAPLVNPIVTVDASGLILVQYRNDSGDVRLQVPSESVVRAYRQRGTDDPSSGSTEAKGNGVAAADQTTSTATAASTKTPAPASSPSAVTTTSALASFEGVAVDA